MMVHTGFGDQHIPEKTKQMSCEKKIYVTGTVRANRKGWPPSINKKQIVKNALVAVRSEH